MNTMLQNSGTTNGSTGPAHGAGRPAGGTSGRSRPGGYSGARTMGDSWDMGAKSSATGRAEPGDGSGHASGIAGWLHSLFG